MGPWKSKCHVTDDVTWPERSRSWPQYVWCPLSRKRPKIATWWQWSAYRKSVTGNRMATWKMTSRDHERSRSWPQYVWCLLSRKWLSPAFSEIMGIKHIGVMTLTFQGHVTSSVMWPCDSQGPVSYRHSIVTKSLSPAVSEIMGIEHIGVMILTFQGHVTSSVTWPLDSGWVISYWWSIKPKSLSRTVSEIFRP